MSFNVYIILCEDGSFYTGHTRQLDLRMKRHMDGKGAGYTRMHKPVKFVYAEEFSSRSQAMNREREIKKMNHTQKLALTKQFGRR